MGALDNIHNWFITSGCLRGALDNIHNWFITAGCLRRALDNLQSFVTAINGRYNNEILFPVDRSRG